MGTRDIAVPALQALLAPGQADWQVVGVFTQPDRPAGRAQTPLPPAVKTLALANDLPVFQPETLRGDEAPALLAALAPDVGVVASYAQLLPRRVLQAARAGWLNVHPSLLPRWRGPSPVAGALLAGDAETGVTIIKLVRAMDAGPIVDQTRDVIRPDDTTATLTARLGELGAERLAAVLDPWVAGAITPTPQDEQAATYTPLLSRADGELNWGQPAAALERRVRAFTPWPGTFTRWDGRRLSILGAHAEPGPADAPPGQALGLAQSAAGPALRIACGNGVLAITRLQLEGRRPLDAAEFVRGQPGIIGARLGADVGAAGG